MVFKIINIITPKKIAAMMIKNGKDYDVYDPCQRKNLILKLEKLWMYGFFLLRE